MREATIAKQEETRVACPNGYTYREWQDVKAEEAGYGQAQTRQELDDV
jgi:hypothetical protein